MILLFLIGCAFGFLLGTAAGAIAAGVLLEWVKDGTATTLSPSALEARIENPISPQFSDSTMSSNLREMLQKNQKPIRPENDTSD